MSYHEVVRVFRVSLSFFMECSDCCYSHDSASSSLLSGTTIAAKRVIYVFHHAAVLFALVACVSVDILPVFNALLMAQPL